VLDDLLVEEINANLTAGTNIATASTLVENVGICFMGVSPKGPFDISEEVARKMIAAPVNVNGKRNSDVIRPVLSGIDIVGRERQVWTIDFGTDLIEEEAAKYELPFEYVRHHVLPVRSENNRASYRSKWWLFGEPRPAMREALRGKSRYIATPATSKYRIFTWVDAEFLCNQGTLVFARQDDYFFGVLQSQIHEIWALSQGTQLESRPRYTPNSTFDTFPFPYPPGAEPSERKSPVVRAIADAARNFVRLRDAWLNPPLATPDELRERTITNLYNTRPTWLESAHQALDRAVFAAYGLTYPLTQNEILHFLLTLNHERDAGHVRVLNPELPPKKAQAVERPPKHKRPVKYAGYDA
jgi:hypothetical protein